MENPITATEYENALRLVRDYEAQQLRETIRQEISKAMSDLQPATPQDELLTIEQAAEYLHLSVGTLYAKVSSRAIPVSKRAGRLYFSKLELMEYVKKGRKMTAEEIQEEAARHVNKWRSSKKR